MNLRRRLMRPSGTALEIFGHRLLAPAAPAYYVHTAYVHSAMYRARAITPARVADWGYQFPLVPPPSTPARGPLARVTPATLRGPRCALCHAPCGASPCGRDDLSTSIPPQVPVRCEGRLWGDGRDGREAVSLCEPPTPPPTPAPLAGAISPPAPSGGARRHEREDAFLTPAHGPQHRRTAAERQDDVERLC